MQFPVSRVSFHAPPHSLTSFSGRQSLGHQDTASKGLSFPPLSSSSCVQSSPCKSENRNKLFCWCSLCPIIHSKEVHPSSFPFHLETSFNALKLGNSSIATRNASERWSHNPHYSMHRPETKDTSTEQKTSVMANGKFQVRELKLLIL